MRILSIDGGGYLGLASVSFLQSMETHFGTRCADRFDLFCGTSTGAIIALALATGMSAEDVTSLYEDLGPKVFPPPNRLAQVVPKLRGMVAARHDNGPLRTALEGAFGETTLGDLRAKGKLVLVTAFSLSAGRPRVFKTDHAPGLTAHDCYRLRDVALASAAAPMYLPMVDLVHPVTRVSERYCDGGVAANSPALLGFVEAVSDLACVPGEISLLSIATPRLDLSEHQSAARRATRRLDRGYIGWGFGEKIISLALDGATMLNDSALARLSAATGARYQRVRFTQPAGVELDKVTPDTTETLRALGADRASSGEIRAQLEPYFTDRE